jgi:hypothetical protein
VQEQIASQLVQVLQERANLDPEKAQQVARVVMEFIEQHGAEIAQAVMGGQGGDLPGGLGKIFGR